LQGAGGFRVADWSAKFYCDDPRYYGSSSWTENSGTSSQGGLPNMNTIVYQGSGTTPSGGGPTAVGNPHTIVHDGNTKAFPIIVLQPTAGTYTDPIFCISTYPVTSGVSNATYRNNGIAIGFSKLSMNPGDQLVVMCDPRPEYSLIAATYYQGGGWPGANLTPVNALAYCVPGGGDIINNIDFQYFLPWISSSTVDDGSGGMNTLLVTANVPQNTAYAHTIQLLYFDTYL